MKPQVFTYADAVKELEEFCREASISASSRPIRSAIRRAYREVVDAHDWSCLHVNGRVKLQAYQDDGTVGFDLTGGTYERQLTLVGDTWPTDAEDWAVRIETDDGEWVVCDIEARKSSTVVTLNAVMCPVADVTAGASYVAYPRYYRLPNDFGSMDTPVEEALGQLGQYVTPQRMLELDRHHNDSGDIQYFTIGPVPDLYGTMGLFVNPYSNAAETLDFMYKRKPRDLRYVGVNLSESPGTITATADSATIAGSSTTFVADHVGSLLRVGTSTTEMPTGLDGLLPYSEQRTITAYSSATAVTVDTTITTTRSAVQYSITDPIDLEPSVYDAMMAMARKYIAIEKNHANWKAVAALADERLFRAKCGDCRVTSRQVAGARLTNVTRLSDSPTSNRYEVE